MDRSSCGGFYPWILPWSPVITAFPWGERMGPGPAGSRGDMSFIVTPVACYCLLPSGEKGKTSGTWGFAVQLYGIRSERNYGMGDFRDLRRLLEFCAEAGASALLLNPLHANFPDAPEHASPYSPSNRAYFNVLYLDVESVPDFLECEQARVMAARPNSRRNCVRCALRNTWIMAALPR